MEMTADQRIAQVQSQAPDVDRGEAIAEASHHSSMAVGAVIAADGGPVGLLAFAAGVGGGHAGAWLAEKLHADEFVAQGLEAVGMHRIGAGGPHPATVGHQIAHSHAFAGFLAAVAVGVLAAVATGVLIAATGGAAAVVIIGAAAAGGFAGGFLGGALSGALSQMGVRTGTITTGSPNVFIGGKPVARMTDLATCTKEPAPVPLIEGSQTIFVNGLPMARIGHKLMCGAVVDEGNTTVSIDNTVVACAKPAPEVPVWARVAADWLGFLPLGKAAAWAGKRSGKTNSTVSKGGNPCASKTCAKDPVDVATGEFVEWRTDIAIPGVLPITLKRFYASGQDIPAPSLFGQRWGDSFSICLIRQAHTIEYWDEEGVCLVFDTPHDVLNAHHQQAPHLALQGTRDAPLLLDRRHGITSHFTWHGDAARLARVEDSYGNQYRLLYEDQRLRRIEHSDGYCIECHWTPGKETPVISSLWLHDPDHAPVELARYDFDPCRRLIRSQSETSGHLYYRYDDAHRIVAWGDASHTHVQLRYNAAGRVEEVITPHGIHGGRLDYDPTRRITRAWTDGQATAYHYNEHNLVTRIVNPLGQTSITAWDAYRRKTAETDARGCVTQYEYDDAGLLSTIIDHRARRTRFTYDDATRLVAMDLPDGRRLRWDYDHGGNVIAATAADGNLTRCLHDAAGRLVRTESADGATTTYLYDSRHRPCGSIAPNGAQQTWRQDRLGRVLDATDAMGNVTRYTYPLALPPDLQGARSSAPRASGHVSPAAMTLPTGETISWLYDQEGLPCRVTDAAGHSRHYQWGAYDLLASETDAAGQTIHYAYDNAARLARITNAFGQTWRFIYDAAGQLVEETDFAQRTTHYRYDAAGRLIQKAVAGGPGTHYRWDAAERLCSIDAGDCRIDYEYDQHDRLLCATLIRGEETESQTRWSYDGNGRVTGEQQDGRALAWEYDALGRCTGRRTPEGASIHRHDALGLLRSAHLPEGDIFIGRDALGRETSRGSIAQLPGDAPATPHFHLQQHYDAAGRILAQQMHDTHGNHVPLRHYHWRHGRLAGIDDARFGGVRYTTDARDQILRVQYDLAAAGQQAVPQVAQEAFAYNALGDIAHHGAVPPHRLHELMQPVAQHYAHGKAVQRGNLRYRYDPCSRLIEKTEYRNGFRAQTWHFTWDGFDRLIKAQTPQGDIWRYTYDAFGRRTGKRCIHRANPRRLQGRLQREDYLWDGAALAVQWKTYADGTGEVGGAVRTETLAWHHHPGTFTPMAVSYRRNGGAPELLHLVTDHLGTPREAVTNQGEVVWAAQLQTWGKLNRAWRKRRNPQALPHEEAANDPYIELDLRLPNQWEDKETGLYYNCQRYYDPECGQYVSSDPIGIAGGLRSHGYVLNPTTWMDPLGLAGCSKLANRIQERANNGKIPKIAPGKVSPKGYHGRLTDERMLEIVKNPDGVYASSGGHGNIIFAKDGDIVVFAGDGAGAYKGQAITSYGPSGPRGESGVSVHGGSPTDPGLPITHDMIVNGKIPKPDGSFLPPANPIN